MSDIVLTPHRRGDPFVYSTELENGWVAVDFTGGMKFTLRRWSVGSEVVTDDDAVDQASIATGEIVVSGTSVTITIPSERTNTWPCKELLWDLQGVVSGATPRAHTIAAGTINILPDVTRSM
jgi:hypothetical protein